MSYLGIDIGGTKTLVAILDNQGIIIEQERFETPPLYSLFLEDLAKGIEKLTTKDVVAAGVGVPGLINRKDGIAIALGNLPWKDVPIREDVHNLVHCDVVIENDARLAALSEAMLLKDTFQKVMYLTVSTGLGMGVIVNGLIDPALADSEVRGLELLHKGHLAPWESFASGKAMVKRFGKRAEDIHDSKTWQTIAADLAEGLVDLIAIIQPDVVVFGGGVGQYLERFEKPLMAELNRYANPLLPIPVIRKAIRPNEAVIYGCYDLAKATYG